MDNINNNNPENQDGHTYPNPDEGANGNNTARYSQGRYPEPPEWTKNIVISPTPWPAPGEKGSVSVQFNESEKAPEKSEADLTEEDSFENEEKKELPMWMQIGIVVVAAIIVLLLVKQVSGLRKTPEETQPVIQTYPTETTTVNTTVPITVTLPEKITTERQEQKTTTKKEEPKTTTEKEEKTTSENDKETSDDTTQTDKVFVKEQVLEYFNESSNRVKTEATKVVKNFENRTHNEDKMELPAAIRGVGKKLLEDKITDITEPTEYPSTEAIIARYPAPGQEWSSKLTVDDIEEAQCVEKDDEYEITIKLVPYVDPEPGKGTSKAMDCLNVPEVRDTAPPFVTSFSAEYYDCVIRCRVEKETGRVIWSNYTTPVIIKIGLDAGFIQFDAQVGITFEKDYTITY